MSRPDSIANVYDGLPLALTAADFDAPDAAGGTYLFERLLGWGAAMRVRLRAKKIPLEVSAPPAGDGARHLYFSRSLSRSKSERIERVVDRADLSAKAPIRRTRPTGACLSFSLHEDAVEVALEVPAKSRAERGALMDLLADRITRAALVATICALPHPFLIGRALQPAKERHRVQDVTGDVLLNILTDSSRGSDALWIGWHVPRSLVLAHSATFGGETEGAMLALGELFRQIAWSPSKTAASAPRPKRSARHRARETDEASSLASESPESSEHEDDSALPPPSTLEREVTLKTRAWTTSDAAAITRGRGLLRSSSSTRLGPRARRHPAAQHACAAHADASSTAGHRRHDRARRVSPATPVEVMAHSSAAPRSTCSQARSKGASASSRSSMEKGTRAFFSAFSRPASH